MNKKKDMIVEKNTTWIKLKIYDVRNKKYLGKTDSKFFEYDTKLFFEYSRDDYRYESGKCGYKIYSCYYAIYNPKLLNEIHILYQSDYLKVAIKHFNKQFEGIYSVEEDKIKGKYSYSYPNPLYF